MPDTINGFPILAMWHTPKRKYEEAGRIIVVDRGEEYEERYVVAWQAHGSTSWEESAYCLDKSGAARVFAKRIEREVRDLLGGP